MCKIIRTTIVIVVSAVLISSTTLRAQKNVVTKLEEDEIVNTRRVKPVKLEVLSVPHTLNYQGFLTDNNGSPVNGNIPMTFRVFDAPTGGNGLWEGTYNVNVVEGVFSVILTPPPSIFFTGQPLYLELVINGEVLSPRTEITSMPWSYYSSFADNADLLDNKNSDEFVQSLKVGTGLTGSGSAPNPSISFDQSWGDSRYINSGESAGGDLEGSYPNPVVTKIRGRLIAVASPNQGDVLKWNGLAWVPAPDETGTGLPGGQAG